MSARTFPRIEPRRSAGVRTWWARAVASALEEAAYDPADLKKGAGLARRGEVGQIELDAGRVVAAVMERGDAFTVTVTVPVMDPDEAQAFAEVVGAGAGWVGSLLRGDVPASLDEALEEAGVELLPYGGLSATCGCDSWVDPCRHGLAVLTQVAWLVEADPLVLLHLRGLERADLVARLAGTAEEPATASADWEGELPDLEVAVEAAEQAAALLVDLLGTSPSKDVDDISF
ncbi:hypothetical protein [Nocardioides daphniae]|uniref:SWIM-type domain-containing protein n=1 Tax=Nocardioides daphniae TaxID=402297 RepID=A0A4P7UB24_9ACTN|nr:hypothetical protein [Nocardioides daphniae]QCC76119.1 hypothetical protein E2C04_00950 [Nocardioides daphniae]